MLRIRFFRTGRKRQPFYKIVVTDKNNPPASGRFKETVGFYNPLTKECKVDNERVSFWIDKGAQPSDVVYNLFVKKGVLSGKKVDVVSLTKKRQEKMEKEKNDKKVEEIKDTEKSEEVEVPEEVEAPKEETPTEEKPEEKEVVEEPVVVEEKPEKKETEEK